MISIIIASVNPLLLASLRTNIAEKVGVAFEIIAIDNGEGKMGLCELYNKAAAEAKYNFLCFMHEDLTITTNNWGSIVIDNFTNNPKLGLIGVAGSKYKSAAPSTWHCFEDEAPELLHYNLIQHYKFSVKEKQLNYSNPAGVKLTKVACVDGLWFCCTRTAIETYAFDQHLLKGFHGYDLDFSLGIGQHFDVAVTFEILIEHFSEGNTNKAWLEDILKVHEKWSDLLPINIAGLPKEKIFLLEKRGFRNAINMMKAEGFTYKQTLAMLMQGKKSRIMTIGLFLKLYWYLFLKLKS